MGRILKQKAGSMQAIDGPMAGLLAAQMRRVASGHGETRYSMGVYSRLPARVQAMVDAAVRDFMAKEGCRRGDVIWVLGFTGRQPIIHVKRRPRLEISA